MEIYFGQEKAVAMAQRLGSLQMPADEVLRPAAVPYALDFLPRESEERHLSGNAQEMKAA